MLIALDWIRARLAELAAFLEGVLRAVTLSAIRTAVSAPWTSLALSAAAALLLCFGLGALVWFGFGALAIGIGAMQIALDRGEQLGWFQSPEIVAETIIFFTVISVGGWIYETLLCLVMERRLVRRGVLYGPCCPIYGVGATCVWLCLGWIESPVGVFVAGAILATSIEYATGTFLVHRFHRSWWDYSMFRFNYRGRICLAASLVFFGLCSLLAAIGTAMRDRTA